jgi:hypothetical protein
MAGKSLQDLLESINAGESPALGQFEGTPEGNVIELMKQLKRVERARAIASEAVVRGELEMMEEALSTLCDAATGAFAYGNMINDAHKDQERIRRQSMIDPDSAPSKARTTADLPQLVRSLAKTATFLPQLGRGSAQAAPEVIEIPPEPEK